jgi:hypothetical protein
MAASVYREVHRPTTVSASYQGAFERLEPVRLEIFQARFLGGGGLATDRCYPAIVINTTLRMQAGTIQKLNSLRPLKRSILSLSMNKEFQP